MRNNYSKEFELEMYEIANKHTLDELLNISKSKYGYDITKDKLRMYLSKRQIRYKDYNINKVRDMGKYIPIGTEFVKPDGMTYIKIANNKWQYKQRYIYEKYYNVKLTDDDYIIFLDHNRSNFDINNLKKVSKRESAVMGCQHLFSEKADVTKVGIDTAKLIIKLKEMREDMNIYEKQMKDLNLNPKEYAELTGIPYELIKDVIYDKEGNYSMEIKDFLRKNVFNKHQEIEKDKENMKLKGMEMKMNNDNEIMKWYKNEYTLEGLKKQLNVSAIQKFEDKYIIKVKNKKASHWFYTIILAKNCLKPEYQIKASVLNEFLEQLYDIMVNGNENKYMRILKEVKKDKVEEMKKDFIEMPQPIFTKTEEPKIEFMPIEKAPINSQDDILRKLLINRLTDEERELIRIFGGKVE